MGAKLFGIAALVIAVIALVPARATDTSLDLYVHATYIVVNIETQVENHRSVWPKLAGRRWGWDLRRPDHPE